jgi:hypothetical protein
MKNLRLGSGFVVFLLFFGVALLDAVQSHNWVRAAFWVAIGTTFFVMDNVKKRAG